MEHLLAGFGIGIALIAAIGAQNAFVLRQGIRREHALVIVLVCAASDALLIAAGVAGVGTVIERFPAVLVVVTWVGAAFLVVFGLLAARRMVRSRSMITPTDGGAVGLGRVVAVCLAFTWLNPHVYLDTVLLVGSIANGQGDGRWAFAAGAMAASATWFAALGFGARLLSGVFERPTAWRVLDGGVAAMMLALGLSLITPVPLWMLLLATVVGTSCFAAVAHLVSRRKTPVGMGTGTRSGEVAAL